MFSLENRTETRPDAPTTLVPRRPEGHTRNTAVPTSSKHPDTCQNSDANADASTLAQILGIRSAISRELRSV